MTRTTGVSVRSTAQREVTLVCPRCGIDRDGAVVSLQRYFFVLGAAVFPLAKLEPMIECGTCHYRSGSGVLDVPTTAVLAERLEHAMRLAVATMARSAGDDDGRISLEVNDEVVDVMHGAGYDYQARTLRDDALRWNDADTAAALQLLADDLTPHGKQSFLHRMITIALADGAITRNEQRALVDIGVGLGMAAPHINGVLAVAMQYLQPAA